MSIDQEIQDLLNNNPPKAGDQRNGSGSNFLFLSPMPSAVDYEPVDSSQIFTKVNNTYLEVGGKGNRRTWQLQVAISLIVSITFVFYICPMIMVYFMYYKLPRNITLFQFMWEYSEMIINIMYPPFLIIIIMLCVVLIYSVIEQRRISPIYFNRQRREIAFFPKKGKSLIIQPWESAIIWIGEQIDFNGKVVLPSATMGFILQDKTNPERIEHPIIHSYAAILLLSQWSGIYNYMEKGVHHCPPATPDKFQTLKDKRQEVHQNYRKGYCGLSFVVGWYFWTICTLWQLSYWIAHFEHKYIHRYNPTSELLAWLKLLPEGQWAKPSAEFLTYQG